jgi:hypothetical protein
VKEAVAAAVSRTNTCPYCVEAHELLFVASGGTQAVPDLDSAPLTGALFALRSSGFFALMRRLNLNTLLTSSFARVHFGGDQFVVHASASDLLGTTVACVATGRNEGRATGIVAAHVVRVLDGAAPPAGVVHIDRLVNPSAFFTDLAEDGIVFQQL